MGFLTFDGLRKVSDFTVNILDNGFTVTLTGYDENDNWQDVKMIVPNTETLTDVVEEIVRLPRK